jgi:hypothetical protein
VKKKLPRQAKLSVNKETLTRLDQVYAGNRTVDITGCVTNCPVCATTDPAQSCRC